VRLNWSLPGVFAFDETGGSDTSDRKYRTEGWQWILAGGGVYNHLDFSFTTDRPRGTAVPLPPATPGGGGPELRRQLRVLKEFIESFDFTRMAPADGIIKEKRITGEGAAKATARALGETGKAYAIYVDGGKQATLLLDIPGGKYKAEWINTKTGAIEKNDTLDHSSETLTLTAPAYSEDIAIRLKRQ
jgi:hypothetical protein